MKRAQLITPYPLEDVTVLGITTVLKPYKFAWLINQSASLKLAHASERYCDTLGQPNGQMSYFLFAAEHCTFRLVKNGLRSLEETTVGYLIPSLKQFDFFFTIQDATATFQIESFYNTLSTMKQITYMAHLPESKWSNTDLMRVLTY